MCGLAGVASSERRRNELARKDAFKQMLEAAAWRGKDATGVACVKLGAVNEPAVVYKRAIKAWDFVELEHYRRIERNFDEYAMVLGHARSSTSDGWNLADANAHPFQCGPITLVHNGTVRNARSIDSGIDHPVDSAHVAAALAEQDADKLLPRLSGPFALVWHDARDGSLNFAKNHEKPLWWCYVEKENTMFWHSELETAYAVLFRNDIKIDGKFRHASPYNHFKFTDMTDLRKYTRAPFGKPPSPPSDHTRHHQHGGAWREETRRLAGPSSCGTHNTTQTVRSESTQPQEKSTKETSTGTTSGSQTATGTTGTDSGYSPPRDSLRPTSRKKIRAVQERLLKFGRKLDAPIVFTPEQWWSYKNQQSLRGCITGHDKTKKQKFQIGNITRDIWGRALKAGKIYGRIVNIKRDQGAPDGYVLVCDYAPDLMEKYVFSAERAVPEVTAEGKPFPESVELGGKKFETFVAATVRQTLVDSPRYTGPGNRKYTEKEFLEMVKHGCAYCNRDLSPEDHETILWVGPHEQSPICEVCSSNSEVRLTLGMHDGV